MIKKMISLFSLDNVFISRNFLFMYQVNFFFCLVVTLCIPVSSSTSLRFSENEETLVSPGKVFAMGIFKTASKFPDRRLWYIGIWYKKFPSRVNRDDPLSTPTGIANMSGSYLSLFSQNGVLVWRTNLKYPINKEYVVRPELLDNGNFVIKQPMAVLLQSFDLPTDTLLPGMSISVNISLLSWASVDDPSSGVYTYHISSQQGQIWLRGHIIQRIFPRKTLSSSTNSMSMLRINPDGHLLLFVFREEEWVVEWSFPMDKCDLHNICRSNMVCSFDTRPVCNCIQGFQFNETFRGCVRKTELSCFDNEFWEMRNMKLPDLRGPGTAVSVDMKIGIEECQLMCTRDCQCVAFANVDNRNGGWGCVMWSADRLYDIRSYSIGGQSLYIKKSADHGKSNMKKTTIGLILGGSALLLIFIAFLLFKRRMIARAIVGQNQKPPLDITQDWQSQQIDYNLIAEATNSFSASNKIGEGGFGSVYKGRLLNGVKIAVKRLMRLTPEGVQSFDNEIRLIGLVQHINIVRLLGFFSSVNEKILVYEYLENSGLDTYIYDTVRSSSLNWQKRFDIINGIARGLLYLHQDSRFKIIHLDLKPSNILLGKDMIPKISDFGMARTLEGDETEAIAPTAAGIYGYMSPEYVSQRKFSVKADVFSFGVMLLEIISGKKSRRFAADNEGESLLTYVWRKWHGGNGMEIVDPFITTSPESRPQQILRFVQIGLLCVQLQAEDRPTMSTVVFLLGTETLDIDLPNSPTDTSSSSSVHVDESQTVVCQISRSIINPR